MNIKNLVGGKWTTGHKIGAGIAAAATVPIIISESKKAKQRQMQKIAEDAFEDELEKISTFGNQTAEEVYNKYLEDSKKAGKKTAIKGGIIGGILGTAGGIGLHVKYPPIPNRKWTGHLLTGAMAGLGAMTGAGVGGLWGKEKEYHKLVKKYNLQPRRKILYAK